MLSPERRDELAGCRTLKRGVVFVHVNYSII